MSPGPTTTLHYNIAFALLFLPYFGTAITLPALPCFRPPYPCFSTCRYAVDNPISECQTLKSTVLGALSLPTITGSPGAPCFRVHLESKDLLSTITASPDASPKLGPKKDATARTIIMMYAGMERMGYILNLGTAYEQWEPSVKSTNPLDSTG
jgi:hypothetical protein